MSDEGLDPVSRREFLQGAKGWSAAVVAVALATEIITSSDPALAGGWVNRRGGGGGWVNGAGGGGWINGAGGGGGGWINGAGAGGWVNRRGGGGAWVNR